MVTFLFRWTTGFWLYSGQGKPPMFGDFEAQRHWLELTTNLPATHWYFHNLEWWGLDYPPLTAYHSWVLGRIGHFIEPKWFQLYLSRGLDNPDLKVFMRGTVIASEYLICIPAAVICVRQLARYHSINSWELSIALTALLMQPATILIDHGHFQYNTVMLGFMLASIASIFANHHLWASVFFVAALGFKQMALFYAPAVAAYLAGICIFPRLNPIRFLLLAIVTLTSFLALYTPLLLLTLYDNYRSIKLPSDSQLPPLLTNLPFQIPTDTWYYPLLIQLTQSLHRIFPFSRGLFEDKVANLWCLVHSSGLHKLNTYPPHLLPRFAIGLTLLAITPASLLILLRPSRKLLPLALASSAWAFFLCSYQVHEKNVLLPLLPTTLLLATKDGMKPSTRAWVGFANTLASWTLFPLLTKDELRVPYAVLTALWAYLLGLPPFAFSAYTTTITAASTTESSEGSLHWTSKLLHLAFYSAMGVWHVLDAFVVPPQGKPDLWVVGNVCLGAVGFGLCYLWCLWRLVEDSGVVGNLFGGKGGGDARRGKAEGKKRQ